MTWTATGGTVSGSGLYKAPQTAGVYTVTGTSPDGPSATSTVTVEASGSSPEVTDVDVTPGSANLETGEVKQFKAVATMSDGSTDPSPDVSWSATGGSITGAGLYTAGASKGTYRVIAKHTAGPADTSAVTVAEPAPTVTGVDVTPNSASLETGKSKQFSVVATMSDGSTDSSPAVTWSATGGSVTGSGLYTAGQTAGTFKVIAKSAAGPADTSTVTVSKPAPSAPTVTSLTIWPAKATLDPGATKQYGASATMSDGSTDSSPTVIWSATGGTITSGGLYKAPATGGTYTVTGTSPDGPSATSTVTVTESSTPPSPPTVTSLTVTPGSASLQAGATKQFNAVATMSDGSTDSSPSVTWSATGGSINSGGLYTAGSAAGTFKVIGKSTDGPADTSSVTISVPSGGGSYTTNFPATENPISEGGLWINGGSTGLDWTNVSTTGGHAIGHQAGASYTDATALLTGSWTSNQEATGKVYASGTLQENCYSEVELRLRASITAHKIKGYEIGFKVSSSSVAYLIVVRWNGSLGNFTMLKRLDGAKYGVKNGDVVKATVVGNVITVYKNGTKLTQVTDNTYSSGSPGMGFNLENAPAGCSGTNNKYGFSSFTAANIVP